LTRTFSFPHFQLNIKLVVVRKFKLAFVGENPEVQRSRRSSPRPRFVLLLSDQALQPLGPVTDPKTVECAVESVCDPPNNEPEDRAEEGNAMP
jgi:hypothetical protein